MSGKPIPLLSQAERQFKLFDRGQVDTREFVCGCVGWGDGKETSDIEQAG